MTDNKKHEADDKSVWRPSQEEAKYTGLSPISDKACSTCRWFSMTGEYGPSCHLISNWPDDIVPNGYCERHETVPVPDEPTPMPVVVVDELPMMDMGSAETGAAKGTAWTRLTGTLKDKVGGLFAGKEQYSGFKVYGNRWVAWWTNNFQDLEGDIFTEKAIDEYITRVDMGLTPYPELWAWHIPGTKHGQADYLARIDHYALASGTFDDTDMGRSARKAYEQSNKGIQMSHGFFYPKSAKQGRFFHQFNAFELTTIPAGAKRFPAANPYTAFDGVTDMPITVEKQKHLEELFGVDIAKRIVETTEAKSKSIEELGIAYKDFTGADLTVNEQAAKEAVSKVEADFKALIPDLFEGQAETVKASSDMVKALKTYKDATDQRLAEQDKALAALKQQLDDRPRSASRAAETVVENDAVVDKLKEQLTKRDPFTGLEVSQLD